MQRSSLSYSSTLTLSLRSLPAPVSTNIKVIKLYYNRSFFSTPVYKHISLTFPLTSCFTELEAIAEMIPFNLPLLNSANPWATTQEDLQALYDCPYTGAVTTRTCTLNGFQHDDSIHQHCFFAENHAVTQHSNSKTINNSPKAQDQSKTIVIPISSLNTLGYSPLPLRDYIYIITRIIATGDNFHGGRKPIIFSVTGSASEVSDCYRQLSSSRPSPEHRYLMEINLSCPNIRGKPPPAYSKDHLSEYLRTLNEAMKSTENQAEPLEIGIKTPPYTHQAQFTDLISALLSSTPCPISFITATNTLGSCLILSPEETPTINSADGSGIGGMAGAALHPLALGNVRKIRQMLDVHEELRHIKIIGVGGVSDGAGYRRMRSVGADAVAVGTALGSEGIGIFEKIADGM